MKNRISSFIPFLLFFVLVSCSVFKPKPPEPAPAAADVSPVLRRVGMTPPPVIRTPWTTNYLAAGAVGSNVILISPTLTNGVNYGNAFSSHGSAAQSEQFGSSALAGAVQALAVGNQADAVGVASTAVGASAATGADRATALGELATADGVASTALGYSATVIYDNSTAVGQNAAASRPHQVMIGTSSDEVNVPGEASVGGITNRVATANTVAIHDSHSKIISLANGGANTVVHGTAPPTETAVVEGDFGFTDITTANASTSAHGLAPKGDNSAVHFLNGQLGFVGLTLAGAQFANQGTTTTLLHGNASGNPSFGSVVEGDLSFSDVTTANASTSAHGLLPKGDNSAVHFLDGQLGFIGLTLAGAQFANQGTATTVLHGNASGNPSFGSVVEGDFGFTDVTTANASTSAHGLMPKGDANVNHFFNGNNAQTSIPDGALSGNVPLINAQNNFTGSNFVNNTIGFLQAMLATNSWANGPTGGIDFAAGGYQEYRITSGNCAITGILNKPSALMPFVELMLTNSTGSDSTVFYTGAITTDDGARSWVVTNKTARSVWVRYAPSGLTNASSRPWF